MRSVFRSLFVEQIDWRKHDYYVTEKRNRVIVIRFGPEFKFSMLHFPAPCPLCLKVLSTSLLTNSAGKPAAPCSSSQPLIEFAAFYVQPQGGPLRPLLVLLKTKNICTIKYTYKLRGQMCPRTQHDNRRRPKVYETTAGVGSSDSRCRSPRSRT